MRSAIIYTLLFSFVLIQGCKDKNHVFVRHTDVEEAGLKGKVRSIVSYQCSLSDSTEHCNVYRKKFDSRGFLVEQMDTVGHDFFSYKYFYNEDGLLDKMTFSASPPFPASEDSYQYSFREGKKTCFTRYPGSSQGTADTSVSLYDNAGHEIQYRSHNKKQTNKYDEHGYLIWSAVTLATRAFEISYINDDHGKILKKNSSDNGEQTHVYDKNGNEIQRTTFGSPGKKLSDYYTGYCEFDKEGNYLKSISFSPQMKDMWVNRRIIEYY